MLAIGRELRETHPDWDIVALGTPDGLEAEIVPRAGFELLTIDKVPMPRSISPALLKFPGRFAGNISAVRKDHLLPQRLRRRRCRRLRLPARIPRREVRRRSRSSSTKPTRNREWPTASARD
jgi:hypothetical protein